MNINTQKCYLKQAGKIDDYVPDVSWDSGCYDEPIHFRALLEGGNIQNNKVSDPVRTSTIDFINQQKSET